MKVKNSVAIFLILLTLSGIVDAAEASCARRRLAQDEPLKKIQALKEVQVFFVRMREQGIQPIIREDSAEDNRPYAEFSVGESHATHMVLWNRFRVDNTTGDVFVFDVELDDYIPMTRWHQKD